MLPDKSVRKEYLQAFQRLVARIEQSLRASPRRSKPVRMYVAGGAAMHFYTGERVSEDVDAVFSRRIALPEGLDIAYRDADGRARVLYFDRQYNDTLGLLHEAAHDDSVPLSLEEIDAGTIDVRLLSPLDLAVSKIGRLSEQDREDISVLARRGLIDSTKLRQRAEEAAAGYVGDVARLRNSIEIAIRIVEDAAARHSPRRKR